MSASSTGVKDPFTELRAGDVIKVPNDEIKDIVLNSIQIY